MERCSVKKSAETRRLRLHHCKVCRACGKSQKRRNNDSRARFAYIENEGLIRRWKIINLLKKKRKRKGKKNGIYDCQFVRSRFETRQQRAWKVFKSKVTKKMFTNYISDTGQCLLYLEAKSVSLEGCKIYQTLAQSGPIWARIHRI